VLAGMEGEAGDSHSLIMGESLIISGRVPGTREKMIVLKDDVGDQKERGWGNSDKVV